jgi:hypothetical protein
MRPISATIQHDRPPTPREEMLRLWPQPVHIQIQ